VFRRRREPSNLMIDDLDDLPPSDLDEEVIEGAAEDSASGEQATASLPRVLRYAVLASRADHSVYQCLVAEIETVCPGMALTETWIDTPDAASGCALAIELDHRAVREDKPECRSLADCVRLISLALPRDRGLGEEHRRIFDVPCCAISMFGGMSFCGTTICAAACIISSSGLTIHPSGRVVGTRTPQPSARRSLSIVFGTHGRCAALLDLV